MTPAHNRGRFALTATLQFQFAAALAVAILVNGCGTPGAPRSLTYFVELVNRNGRSAGPSNPAVVLAGQAPPPIEGLSAKTVKAGVVLRWASTNSTESVRLHRKLLTPPASKLKT